MNSKRTPPSRRNTKTKSGQPASGESRAPSKRGPSKPDATKPPPGPPDQVPGDLQEPLAPDDPIDEASWESFPASDAPAR